MAKKKISIKLFSIMLALLMVIMTGCINTKYPRYDKAAQLKEPYYGSLENGDTYYTPASKSCVADKDRTVLYYNELVLVFTKTDLSDDDINDIAKKAGGEAVGIVSGAIHSIQIKIPAATLGEIELLANELCEDENVMYACPEYPLQIMNTDEPWGEEEENIIGNEAEPGGSDWWAEAIGAYTAWEYSELCGKINVGVVDNSFSIGHSELKGQITMINDNTVDTEMDHGTHVTGIMAAHANGDGIRGIASTAHYYCADMWPSVGDTSFHTIGELLAIYNYMAELDVKVINNSWGCVAYTETAYKRLSVGNELPYSQWMDMRKDKDIVPTAEAMIVMISQLIMSGIEDIIFVQAAGNGLDDNVATENTDAVYNGFFSTITEEIFDSMDEDFINTVKEKGIDYKTIDDRIFVVGSVDCVVDGNGNYFMSDFSNYGETVDICAPGGGVYSTVGVMGGGYEFFSGTSMASPMVTASIAFVWSIDPTLSVCEVRDIILNSAQVKALGVENGSDYSYPMLNVGAAVERVAQTNKFFHTIEKCKKIRYNDKNVN